MDQSGELARVKALIRARTVARGCTAPEALATAAKVGDRLTVCGLAMTEIELRPALRVLAALLLAYIVLGAVMDELAMILLALPVFFPVVTALDFGLDGLDETTIWFGILVLVVVGIGLTAPPIGCSWRFPASRSGWCGGSADLVSTPGRIPFRDGAPVRRRR